MKNTRLSLVFSKKPLHKWLAISIVLHVGVLVFLLLGDMSSAPKPLKAVAPSVAQPIKAVVVDAKKLENAINKVKKQKSEAQRLEQQRIKDLEKRASDAKKRRAKEQARIKNLEAQRKKKEKEKIAADKAAKKSRNQAAKAEKLRKQKEQEKQKSEEAAAKARSKRLKEEEAARQSEIKRKKDLAEKKRLEKEAKEREAREAELAAQMAADMAKEMQVRNQARQQQVLSETQRYAALITNTIDRHMINDRSTMEGKSCRLTINLAPSGFVLKVTVESGDSVVCQAAERAIFKAGTLPVSKDPEVFKEMRNIGVTVKPEF
ncbi:MAG: cell envelope integrity protein TolA [Colwellia sp.]